MNFAFCIFKYYPYGGLERNFIRILDEVISRGDTVTVFTMKWEGDIPDYSDKSSLKIVTVPCSGISNHSRCSSYVKNLSRIISTDEFNLVVGFNRMPGLDLYYCADVCFSADIAKRHTRLFRLTPRYRIFSSLEKAVFRLGATTHILALSNIQKRIYMQTYGTEEQRFHSVPAGIDKDKIRKCISSEQRLSYREKFGVADKDKMVIMIGSDFIRKGVARSLNALSDLPADIRDKIKLFIIGTGKRSAVLRLAEKLKIAENIIFTGGVDNVPEYLAAADLLLHPAVSENTGNAIVEALIAGVPVLATSNCGYAFHVENADAGIVVDGDKFSQREMNMKLHEFLAMDEEGIRSMRKNAISYSDSTDFYTRPTVIADIIYELSEKKDVTANSVV